MGREVGVASHQPPLIQPIAGEHVVVGYMRSPGGRFLVGDRGGCRDHVAVSGLAGPQPEHHIAATQLQTLVESSDFLEYRPAYRQAGAGHRQRVADPIGGTHQAVGVRSHALEQMACQAVHPDNRSAELDETLIVDELEAGHTDLGTRGPTDEISKPPGMAGRGVVVQEHQNLAIGLGRSPVIYRRVVERLIPPDDLGTQIRSQILIPILVCRAVSAVVHYHEIKDRIAGRPDQIERSL